MYLAILFEIFQCKRAGMPYQMWVKMLLVPTVVLVCSICAKYFTKKKG